jgi:sugar transferase EpsL
MKFDLYRKGGKRLADLFLASILLVILLPLFLVVALLVRIKLGSPVLFRQSRPGRGGQIFTLIKFRSMREAHREDGTPLPDQDRLTPFGSRLRATSIDEIPELWNVLRGRMSLVGPRPLLVEYLGRYTTEQARRLSVRPGITGWAQVNGRNQSSWEDRFAQDVWYVDHYSFRIDFAICRKTIIAVVRRKDINESDEATRRPFEG